MLGPWTTSRFSIGKPSLPKGAVIDVLVNDPAGAWIQRVHENPAVDEGVSTRSEIGKAVAHQHAPANRPRRLGLSVGANLPLFERAEPPGQRPISGAEAIGRPIARTEQQ